MGYLSQTVSFIGSGNMAEAIFAGLLKKKIVPPEQIIAADIDIVRLDYLQHHYGIQVTPSNQEAASMSDVVVLAVKPQYFAAAAANLHGQLKPEALALSIMAGVPIMTIQERLAHPAIIRSMPNTPAMVGEGMTMWTATPAVSEGQKKTAEAILTACGEAIFAPEEKFLDMATAINGSGPGFVFLILEAMVDAGVQLGFARPVAEKLVVQTVLGAALYARESDDHLAQLRNQVTSPGGTTAAGLFTLEQEGVRAALAKAIFAAYRRSVELGK